MTLQAAQPRIAVVVNAGSGSVEGEALVQRICASFADRGLLPEWCVCGEGDEIRSFAEEAVREGCTMVVAGGGDGTLSTVASVLAGSETALGVLPLGTLNHFAKDAGIPLDLEGSVATVAEGEVRRVDMGEVNGRTFINNSSLGLYPMIVHHREAQQRLGRSKWFAFFRGLLTVLGVYPLLKVRLLADGAELVRTTPFLFIGNNYYEIHGLKIGTRTRMDSGQLCAYVTHRIGRSGLLRLVLRALMGRLRQATEFDTLGTTDLQVHVRGRRVRVALDGEVVEMTPPLSYRCRPGALRVVVPRR